MQDIKNNQKTANKVAVLEKSNLVRDFDLSSTYNYSKLAYIVNSLYKKYYCRGDEGNRTPRSLDDKPKPTPSHPHDIFNYIIIK